MFYLSLVYLITLLLLKDKIQSKFKIVVAIIPFLMVIFLRFGVGADYFAYGEIYYRMDPSNINNSLKLFPDVEMLYRLVNLVFRSFGVPYHLFIGTLAALMMMITLKWIEGFEENFELSVLLYFAMFFFVWNLSAMRQGIAIGLLLYVFFNTKKDYSLKVKLLISIIMFFIHASSIVVFFLYMLSTLKWNKKSLLIALVFGLIINLIPISQLALHLENIPYLNKILYYIDPIHISIFSFSSLVRLLFFTLVFTHYDRLIEQERLSKVMLNFTLLSFILYFFLMFSSLLASRLSVYGYILMIIILPSIISTYSNKQIRKIAFSFILAFSILSFYKEMTALVDQTEYKYSITQLNFETIFSKNYTNFNKGYAFSAKLRDINSQETDLDYRINLVHDTAEVTVNEEDTFLSVYFPSAGSFGIINQNGEVVEPPEAEVRSRTYLDIVEVIFNPQEFPTTMFRKIGTDTIFGYWEMEPFAIERSKRDLMFGVHWTNEEPYNLDDLVHTSLPDIVNTDAITKAVVSTNDYFPQFSYLNIFTSVSNYTVLLNENGSVKLNRVFDYVEMYNPDKIAIGYAGKSRYFINEWGDIIWKESIDIPMCNRCN